LIEQVGTCAGKAAEKAVESIAAKMEERLDERDGNEAGWRRRNRPVGRMF